jgi:pyruvate kinase
MLDSGLDICRLNFSHGDHAQHGEMLGLIRELSAQRDEPITILGDLGGPKIRLNGCPPGVTLEMGQTVRIARGGHDCTADELTTNYPNFVDEVPVGHRVLIDDGLVRLLVIERAGPDALLCSCTVSGPISSRKGVNLPDTRLSVPALTEKDLRDLDWAVKNDLDYVCLSFVRHPDDLAQLKTAIRQRRADIGVIVKIEKTEALEHLDELIAESDGVLVARGDLGVEMDVWQVPLVQKALTARCRDAGVPVIIATQMLQSMVENHMPTRAEVSDVANAILDAADAVMLSAETAVGRSWSTS